MYKVTDIYAQGRNKKTPSIPIKIILSKGRSKLPNQIQNLPGIKALSLISRKGVEEDEIGKVTLFEVGLSFNIPANIILQMISSPSLISHGYMIASGIAIVPSRKFFTVQLYKFREGPDLELPYEGVYLVPFEVPRILYNRSTPPNKPKVDNYEFPPEVISSFDQENTLS